MAVHRQLSHRIPWAIIHSSLLHLHSHTPEAIRACLHLPRDLRQQDQHMLAGPTLGRFCRHLLRAFDHIVAPPTVQGPMYGHRLLN